MTLLAAHSTGSLKFQSLIHVATTATSAASTTNTTIDNNDDTRASSATTVNIETHHKRGVMACRNYVGAPLSREQAEGKLNHCPRFKQLVLQSRGMDIMPSLSSNATEAAGLLLSSSSPPSSSSSWSSTFLRHQHQTTTTCDGQDDFDIVDHAVMLEYGTRLRACLLEAKKMKYSTPY